MTRVVNFWDRSLMVEQDAFNVEVVSSSLTGPTIYHIKIISTGAILHKGGVAFGGADTLRKPVLSESGDIDIVLIWYM